MSSSEHGSLRVTSPGADIQVLDAYLRPVPGVGGVGAVHASLPPGAYTVVAGLEGTSASRDVLVRPGIPSEVDLEVPLAPAAPVYRLPTANETHGMLARELSQPDLLPARSALVIVLRGLAGRDMAPLEQAPEITTWDGAQIALPAPRYDPYPPPGSPPRAVGWRIDLEPGAYRVRWTRTGAQPAEHTVWVAEFAKTLLFVPQSLGGPDVAGMSLHLLGRSSAYDDLSSETESVELALSILRCGARRHLLDDAVEMLSAGAPLTAQLFGAAALATHAAVVSDNRIGPRLAATVHRLHAELGNMPDVLALARVVTTSGVSGWVDAPPMLSACMEVLLAADRADPDVIPAGSIVEAITGERFASTPWLLWRPLELEAFVASRVSLQRWATEQPLSRTNSSVSGGEYGAADDIGADGAFGGAGGFTELPMMPPPKVQPQFPAWAEPVSSTVMRRVEEVVAEVAPRLELSAHEAAQSLGAEEIAQRLELPTALVQRSLATLYGDASR